MIKIFWVIFFGGLSFILSGQGSQNPFDVIRSNDTLQQVNAVDSVGSTITDSLVAPDAGRAINPFDVSHIPLRKNQVRTRKQAITSTSGTNERVITMSYLPFWLLILSLLLLSLTFFIVRDYFIKMVRSMFNDNFLQTLAYEQKNGMSFPNIMLNLILGLNAACLVYILTAVETIGMAPVLFFLLLFLGMIGLMILRLVVLNILGWIFPIHKELKNYTFAIFLSNSFLALFLIFLNIFLVFGPESWESGLKMLAVFFFGVYLLMRYSKGFSLSRRLFKDYFFEYFMYFCTLELCSWIVLFKLFKNLT